MTTSDLPASTASGLAPTADKTGGALTSGSVLAPSAGSSGSTAFAGGTGTRAEKKAKKRRTKITKALEYQAAAMVGAGIEQKKTAVALDLHENTVSKLVKSPEAQKVIEQVRMAMRQVSVEAMKAAQPEVFKWLGEVIQARDPKAFDALTRGLVAMERTASSASGEARKIDVKDTTEPSEAGQDVIALFKSLLSK